MHGLRPPMTHAGSLEPTTGTHQLRKRISRAGLDDGGDDGCGLRAFEGSRVVAEADAPQLLAKLAQHCAACVLLSECARAVCAAEAR